MSLYNYRRRATREVKAGNVGIGGANPVRIQSMANVSTLDTEAAATQAASIAAAGGEIVRFTTQGRKEAANMAPIKARMHELGCTVPLVADVHFNPQAALTAAAVCEKVRINPGNFIDAPRQFMHLEYTDEEYASELARIDSALRPLLDICREHGTSIRLGVNHGSLSDRIMSRYGNTPEGMVESAMEFLRACRRQNFHDIVISIKTSNTVIMTETVRLLASEMAREGMDYPLHLGVTEAGDAEDGRIKSAAGIGALLAEGLGDTIRVSLSEPPENEIPVAAFLRDYIAAREGHAPIPEPPAGIIGPSRKAAVPIEGATHSSAVALAGTDFPADIGAYQADASEEPERWPDTRPVILTSSHINAPGEIASYIDRAVLLGVRNPFIIRLTYNGTDADRIRIMAAADYGALLLNGYGSAIDPRLPDLPEMETELGEAILQACRIRFSRPEYIACPGCGRTLFDLQATLRKVKEATQTLKGVKIGVMGCIVNGPGEMADADYGFVGAGPGRVSLYKGKELKVKNIPVDEALPLFIQMIETDRDR